MRWLAECSAEALGEALRVVAPGLSGCPVTVPVPHPAAQRDPQWWSSSTIADGRFLVQLAWFASCCLSPGNRDRHPDRARAQAAGCQVPCCGDTARPCDRKRYVVISPGSTNPLSFWTPGKIELKSRKSAL